MKYTIGDYIYSMNKGKLVMAEVVEVRLYKTAEGTEIRYSLVDTDQNFFDALEEYCWDTKEDALEEIKNRAAGIYREAVEKFGLEQVYWRLHVHFE